MDLIDTAFTATYADSAKVNQNFQTVADEIAGLVIPESSGGIPEIIDARKFGVKMDGTDCTDEFTAAYEEACDVKGTLIVPGGTVIISGFDLGGDPHRGCTIQGASYDARGNGWKSSVIKLADGANRSLFTLLAGDAPHAIFKNLILDGNGLNQTVNDYIVKSDDDLVTAYPYGFKMENVQFINGRGGGLALGQRRGNNTLTGLVFYNNGFGNGGHGIYIDTYDVTMHDCHIGLSGGYGMYINSTSQLQCTSVNSYVNQSGGMYIGAGVNDMVFTNGSIDHNLRFGINSAKRTAAEYPGLRSFVGTRFIGNNTLGPGWFPDVMISSGDKDFSFTGCAFMGYEGTYKPSYAVQFADSTATARFAASKGAAAASWQNNAFTNISGSLILDNRIS